MNIPLINSDGGALLLRHPPKAKAPRFKSYEIEFREGRERFFVRVLIMRARKWPRSYWAEAEPQRWFPIMFGPLAVAVTVSRTSEAAWA